MPLTTAEIRSKTTSIKPEPDEGYVRYYIDPPLAVRCITDDLSDSGSSIKKGQILQLTMFYDQKGKYPNHVHFHRVAYWWPVECFEIVETQPPTA